MTFSKNGLSLFFEPLYFRREFFWNSFKLLMSALSLQICQRRPYPPFHSIYWMFRYPHLIPCLIRWDQISVCFLDPINFRCPFLKPRNKGDFDHWAFTLSLKDGSFQAYFMVVIKKMTIFISLRKAHFWNTPPFFWAFWDLHFGSGLFPFWQWPLSATFWLFSIELMVFLG